MGSGRIEAVDVERIGAQRGKMKSRCSGALKESTRHRCGDDVVIPPSPRAPFHVELR